MNIAPSVVAKSEDASSNAPRPEKPPPQVRPLIDRARDYGIFSGLCGGFVGACMTTRHHASAFAGALFLGGSSALLGASFIGLRGAQEVAETGSIYIFMEMAGGGELFEYARLGLNRA